jgi:hypothetical protein
VDTIIIHGHIETADVGRAHQISSDVTVLEQVDPHKYATGANGFDVGLDRRREREASEMTYTGMWAGRKQGPTIPDGSATITMTLNVNLAALILL